MSLIPQKLRDLVSEAPGGVEKKDVANILYTEKLSLTCLMLPEM